MQKKLLAKKETKLGKNNVEKEEYENFSRKRNQLKERKQKQANSKVENVNDDLKQKGKQSMVV